MLDEGAWRIIRLSTLIVVFALYWALKLYIKAWRISRGFGFAVTIIIAVAMLIAYVSQH